MAVKRDKCYNAWCRLVKRYGDKLPNAWVLDPKSLFDDIGQPSDQSDFIWVDESQGVISKETVRWTKQSERASLQSKQK